MAMRGLAEKITGTILMVLKHKWKGAKSWTEEQ